MKPIKQSLLALLACGIMFGAGCAKSPESIEPGNFETIAPEVGMVTQSPAPVLPSMSAIPTQITPVPTPDDSDLDGIPDPGESPAPSGKQGKTLEDYKKKNSDVIGWIKVPDTRIDYPVVMGKDNSYYLRHDVNKKKSKYGAIFMDVANKEEGQKRHLILYGHRMRDKSMFHDLIKYKEKKFFAKNDKITFNYEGKDTTWQLFSAHNFDTTKQNLTATAFGSDENFLEYMNEVKKLSDFQSDVTVGKSDQVLTLLTCTYEYDNARYVVHFKRVK